MISVQLKICLPSARHINGGWWVIVKKGKLTIEAVFCKTLEGAESLCDSRTALYNQ